ncbi:hypothetical protein OG946_11405 [Streptomyces sp. NBC_01808]|uniref:hypothetical protein n=1 Tax=Streptomyces sp. NBC_01808 TaxID=2975947 RepID=UPI002DD82179|nr:hypothetical protein [Streptomyces sp. NBC_01808]WSA37937.1 hypothetical protein OG946_11405 [Streptomyces sp. NBC_01808]
MKLSAPASAVALAAAITLLTACGSSDDKPDRITGAKETATESEESSSASPSPAADGGAGAPEFDFPEDVKVEVESEPTGDAAEDAILRDHGYAVQSIRLGYAKQDPRLDVLEQYLGGDALLGWRAGIDEFVADGKTVSGTVRYYDREVTSQKGDVASVVYCEDQTNSYAKIADSGKVLKTEPSADDFIRHVSTMRKTADGLWQMVHESDEQGAAQCGTS